MTASRMSRAIIGTSMMPAIAEGAAGVEVAVHADTRPASRSSRVRMAFHVSAILSLTLQLHDQPPDTCHTDTDTSRSGVGDEAARNATNSVSTPRTRGCRTGRLRADLAVPDHRTGARRHRKPQPPARAKRRRPASCYRPLYPWRLPPGGSTPSIGSSYWLTRRFDRHRIF